MQRRPAALRVLRVDGRSRQRQQQFNPFERPRPVLDDREVQNRPSEMVPAVHFSDDSRLVGETLRAARAPASAVCVRRLAQPGGESARACTGPGRAATAASAGGRGSARTRRSGGVDRALQERASLGDRPRSI